MTPKRQQSEEAAAAGKPLSEGRIIDLTKSSERYGFDKARKKPDLKLSGFMISDI